MFPPEVEGGGGEGKVICENEVLMNLFMVMQRTPRFTEGKPSLCQTSNLDNYTFAEEVKGFRLLALVTFEVDPVVPRSALVVSDWDDDEKYLNDHPSHHRPQVFACGVRDSIPHAGFSMSPRRLRLTIGLQSTRNFMPPFRLRPRNV